MKPHRLPLLLALLLLAWSPPAFGRGGLLKRPTLGLPEDLAGRQEIMAVVGDPRFQFIGGVFLNARSALRYAGDAGALNGFVARLAACRGANVRVDFQPGEPDTAWTLDYDSARDAHAFRVIVNPRRVARAAVKLPTGQTR